MKSVLRYIRRTLTIARRDFTATVFTPMFLLFLLTPVLMIGLGVVASFAGASAAGSGEANKRIVIIASADQAAPIIELDRQLRLVFGRGDAPPALRIDKPSHDAAAQAHALFSGDSHEIAAVLYGPLEAPTILRTPQSSNEVRFLTQLSEQVLRARRAGGTARLSAPEIQVIAPTHTSGSGKAALAYFAVTGIFFLTLMLSSQAVGTMAEERSNKVIEILAAAIPLESVFLGKLIGMFGSAVLFILFWGGLIAYLPRLMPGDYANAFASLVPAVGYPAFLMLFAAYFTMAYMLLGAVFLGLGALTSSQRELQMLALPMTVLQFGIFGAATYASTHGGSWAAFAVEAFPFSSPSAMIARAVNAPQLWPHFVALGWQALWVGITVTLGARLFRRGVLKSGSPKLRFKKQRTIDIGVS